MLDVTLLPVGGHARATFPIEGQYGLTPVILQGRVKLRTIAASETGTSNSDGAVSAGGDRPNVPITRIVVRVRCYEECFPGSSSSSPATASLTRRTSVGTSPVGTSKQTSPLSSSPSRPKRILYEKTLLVKESDPTTPEGAHARWDKWSRSFRIVVPVETRWAGKGSGEGGVGGGGGGVSGSVRTKEYQVGWRLEAVVYHSPMSGVGDRVTKSYALNMPDHSSRLPRPVDPAPERGIPSIERSTSPTFLAPRIAYTLSTDTDSIALGSSVQASVALRVPADLKSARAQFSLQRRCTFHGVEIGRASEDVPRRRRGVFRRESSQSSGSASGSSGEGSTEPPSTDNGVPPGTVNKAETVTSSRSRQVITTVHQSDWKEVGVRGTQERGVVCGLIAPREQGGGWETGQTLNGGDVEIAFFIHVRLKISDGLFSRDTEYDILGPVISIYAFPHDSSPSTETSGGTTSYPTSMPKSTGKRKARPLETIVPLYGLGRNADIRLPPPPKATKIKWGDRESEAAGMSSKGGIGRDLESYDVIGIREALPNGLPIRGSLTLDEQQIGGILIVAA